MLLLLFSLFSAAEEPDMSITVTDSQYERIYMMKPKVICSSGCSFERDTSTIFVEANRHHRTWYRFGEIGGIYDDETIKYVYEECDFKKEPHKCAQENGVWVLRTNITIDNDRASINLMLFDENAAVIGQGNYSKFKKTKIIQREKVTRQQMPGQPMIVTNHNKEDGNYTTMPIQPQAPILNQIEGLEPIVVDIPPNLTAGDIGQAMIMLYDSIR